MKSLHGNFQRPELRGLSPHGGRGLKFKLITGRLRDFHPRERALTRRTRNARNGSGLVPGVPTCLKPFMGLGKYLYRGEDKGNPPASFIHTALFNRHRLAFQKAAPIVRINHADCLQICVNHRRPNEFHSPGYHPVTRFMQRIVKYALIFAHNFAILKTQRSDDNAQYPPHF